MKTAPYLVGLAVTGLLLSGCGGSSTHKNAPEPTTSNIVNGTHTQVIQMPEGFRNVAFSCYDTNGVYVTSRGSEQVEYTQPSSVFVVPNDPHCAAK